MDGQNEIIKTTELLELVHRAAGLRDPKADGYCNTLLFWIMCHLSEPYMVLTPRHVAMYNYLTEQVKCL